MNSVNDNSEEKCLVIRLINGDEDAFCELYSVYKNRLLYFAMKFVKSRDFAEDIFQDTFTVIWQSRRFIDPDAPFSSYLHTIVRNRILNHLREIASEDRLREHILAQSIDYTDSTKNEILFEELKEILSRAMKQLTPRQREIFQMSRDQAMSHKEIADNLGVSVNTVQEHVSSSLKVIRSYLNKRSSGIYTDLLLILICLNF
jgi:RNA polymerase sigma-70 factor, Bacteroides expansion family 1